MKITIEVSDAHIDGALTEPHSRYWAAAAVLHSVAETNDLGLAGEVTEREGPDGSPKSHVLGALSITRAIALMATKSPKQFARLLAGDYDGETGDVLLQLMVFGELKYG